MGFFLKFKDRLFLIEKNIESFFYLIKLRDTVPNTEVLKDGNMIDIVTVSFNNANAIRFQIILLKKFCKDRFTFCVADNSTNENVQLEIEKLCNDNGVNYFKLPETPYKNKFPSFSHGLALNYLYKNYLLKRKARYILFLDHDIFPIKEFSVKEFVDKGNGFYGVIRSRDTFVDKFYRLRKRKVENLKNNNFYFWPGLFFVDSTLFRNRKIDFRPKYGGDTGSGLFYSVFYDYFKDNCDVLYFENSFVFLWESSDKQDSAYELLNNDWLHMMGISGWKPLSNLKNKEEIIYSMLENLL